MYLINDAFEPAAATLLKSCLLYPDPTAGTNVIDDI
jgi:hypothetical protein